MPTFEDYSKELGSLKVKLEEERSIEKSLGAAAAGFEFSKDVFDEYTNAGKNKQRTQTLEKYQKLVKEKIEEVEKEGGSIDDVNKFVLEFFDSLGKKKNAPQKLVEIFKRKIESSKPKEAVGSTESKDEPENDAENDLDDFAKKAEIRIKISLQSKKRFLKQEIISDLARSVAEKIGEDKKKAERNKSKFNLDFELDKNVTRTVEEVLKNQREMEETFHREKRYISKIVAGKLARIEEIDIANDRSEKLLKASDFHVDLDIISKKGYLSGLSGEHMDKLGNHLRNENEKISAALEKKRKERTDFLAGVSEIEVFGGGVYEKDGEKIKIIDIEDGEVAFNVYGKDGKFLKNRQERLGAFKKLITGYGIVIENDALENMKKYLEELRTKKLSALENCKKNPKSLSDRLSNYLIDLKRVRMDRIRAEDKDAISQQHRKINEEIAGIWESVHDSKVKLIEEESFARSKAAFENLKEDNKKEIESILAGIELRPENMDHISEFKRSLLQAGDIYKISPDSFDLSKLSDIRRKEFNDVLEIYNAETENLINAKIKEIDEFLEKMKEAEAKKAATGTAKKSSAPNELSEDISNSSAYKVPEDAKEEEFEIGNMEKIKRAKEESLEKNKRMDKFVEIAGSDTMDKLVGKIKEFREFVSDSVKNLGYKEETKRDIIESETRDVAESILDRILEKNPEGKNFDKDEIVEHIFKLIQK